MANLVPVKANGGKPVSSKETRTSPFTIINGRTAFGLSYLAESS